MISIWSCANNWWNAAKKLRLSEWEKTLAYFHYGLDALGIRYEYFDVPYGAGSLRALYLPGSAELEKFPAGSRA